MQSDRRLVFLLRIFGVSRRSMSSSQNKKNVYSAIGVPHPSKEWRGLNCTKHQRIRIFQGKTSCADPIIERGSQKLSSIFSKKLLC